MASESLLLRAGGRLARAARHERRLGNPTNADSLENIRQSISLALENKFTATAEAQVQAIAETDQKRTQKLDSTLSSAIINLTDQSARESEEIAEQLAQLLAEAPPAADASLESGDNEGNTDFQRQDASGSPQASSESSERRLLPMEQSELAQLLDELDKKLNPTAELGAQDNNSTASPVGSESSPPTSLSKAAEGIAQSLSRSRRPPERQASGDLGAATESEMADVSPQPPAQVHIVDVDRLPGSWGQLRQRNAEGTAQSQREDVPAEFREQVDAYFRRLGNASRFSNAETQQNKP